MITVYGTATSPFVRKVLYVLEAKGLSYELIYMNPLDLPEDFRVINPSMKVPAYRDDLITLGDSTVICEYLDDRYPENPVIPEDTLNKARCRWFEEYADSTMLNAFLPLVMEKFIKVALQQGSPDQKIIDNALNNQIPLVMNYLESELEGKDYLSGECLSIADVAVSGIITNAGFADFTVDDQRWPNIAAHHQRVCSNPPLANIFPKMQNHANKFR